ncbi:hypothetical protein [Streptomyces sp. NPDC050535]
MKFQEHMPALLSAVVQALAVNARGVWISGRNEDRAHLPGSTGERPPRCG